ncbi:hypothetical protein E1301_Tti019708 [Triplophysa tibetana]|uniref:Uncharacterized protein n=1 Tax=Triplophysa tibetana TaxID=1572043 RepID=A0A5A9N9V5_9TELE|nr:hypothetical protein E1301_Tti019708 [Triplophysa tibetana]
MLKDMHDAGAVSRPQTLFNGDEDDEATSHYIVVELEDEDLKAPTDADLSIFAPVEFSECGEDEDELSDSSVVYERARKCMEERAPSRGRVSECGVSILAPRTLVYCRSHPLGRNKIQDAWAPIVFEVVECKDGHGNVYEVQRQDGVGSSKCVHRSELRPIPAVGDRMTLAPGFLSNAGGVEEDPQAREGNHGLVVEMVVSQPSGLWHGSSGAGSGNQNPSPVGTRLATPADNEMPVSVDNQENDVRIVVPWVGPSPCLVGYVITNHVPRDFRLERDKMADGRSDSKCAHSCLV